MTHGLWRKSSSRSANEGGTKKNRTKISGSEPATDTDQPTVVVDANKEIETIPKKKVGDSPEATPPATATTTTTTTTPATPTKPAPIQPTITTTITTITPTKTKSRKLSSTSDSGKTNDEKTKSKTKKETTNKSIVLESELPSTAAPSTAASTKTSNLRKPTVEKEAKIKSLKKPKTTAAESKSKSSKRKKSKQQELSNSNTPIVVQVEAEKLKERNEISVAPLPQIIDSKSLERDDLFDLLQSTSERFPSNLKATIIRSHIATQPTELTVKKSDIIFVLFKDKDLLYIRNKKGTRGFVPFVCVSCSLEVQPKKKVTKKRSKRQIVSTTTDTEAETTPVSTLQTKRFVPLKDNSSTTSRSPGSPAISLSSIDCLSSVETLISSEEQRTIKNKSKNNYQVIKRSRSKSVDQLSIDDRPYIQSKEDVCRSGDELERPSTALLISRPDSSLDTGFRSDFSEFSQGSSLERILSPFTKRKFKKASSNSDKEMNKLKFFSKKGRSSSKEGKLSAKQSDSSSRISDSEMSTTSSSLKIMKKNNKKNSLPTATSAATRNLMQARSRSSLGSQFDWYSNLYTDNVSSDSSDSEDDSTTTTDTESIRVYQKKSSTLTDSIFDYERLRGTDRSRARRSSDTSASSEFYVPHRVIPKTLHEERTTNNKRLQSGSSGFAHIHKTSTLEKKSKSKAVDTKSKKVANKKSNDDNNNNNNSCYNDKESDVVDKTHLIAEKNNSQRKGNPAVTTTSSLQRTRLSNSNSSLRISNKGKRGKNYASDTEINQMLSPLVLTKQSDGILVTDPQRPASALRQHTSPQPPSLTPRNNIKMIVSYDFIASEDNDATILAGQQVEVLRKPDIDWWWIRTSDGREGFVPRTFLAEIPTVPNRKPDLLQRLNSAPEKDVNNNNINNMNFISTANARTAVNLPSSSYLSRDSQKLAKVAPLMRDDMLMSNGPDDIALFKKMHSLNFVNIPPTTTTPMSLAPPSYNQHMMTRQKSDLSDNYHFNKQQYLAEFQQQRAISRHWKSQEAVVSANYTQDPGGASRIVRRRSFSGRQKKVRFANDISSQDDEQAFQNSPGQILIIRQTNNNNNNNNNNNINATSVDNMSPYMSQVAADQELEIATWC